MIKPAQVLMGMGAKQFFAPIFVLPLFRNHCSKRIIPKRIMGLLEFK
jgi:hypothetical protein